MLRQESIQAVPWLLRSTLIKVCSEKEQKVEQEIIKMCSLIKKIVSEFKVIDKAGSKLAITRYY